MPSARVVPGHATTAGFTALVLASTPNPDVTVVLRSNRQPASFGLTPLRPRYSPKLAAELAIYGVELFKLVATGLAASTEYAVEDRTSGSLRETVVRTLPARIDSDGLTIALGTCYYEGFGKAEAYLAGLRSTRFSTPAFKLLAGDNLYVDIGPTKPGRDLGYPETVDRYLKYFWESRYADALSTFPTITTWDDHEYWNNYPESQIWLERSYFWGPHRQEYIGAGDECLELFQNTLNPPGVVPPRKSYTFDVSPLSFFVADTRSGRTLYADRNRRMLSEDELREFEGWAASLHGPGIFVIGQPMWIGKGGKTDYNPPDFEVQYARMWKAIAASPFDILVISGDVHHSRVLEIALPNRIVPEFVTSPACHIPTVSSTISGSFSSQGQDGVAVTDHVEIDATVSGAVKPRLNRYLFGTDAKNTIAFLHFRPRTATSVDVGGAFVDLDSQRVPRSTKADLPGWFTGGLNPVYADCQAHPMFVLR